MFKTKLRHLKFIFWFFLIDYKLVHFVGYLRSNYNLKYENNNNNNELKNEQNSSISLTDSLFRSHHSSCFINQSDGESIQHYLVAYVQVKSKLNELDQTKFTSKHDINGNFVHIEPRY